MKKRFYLTAVYQPKDSQNGPDEDRYWIKIDDDDNETVATLWPKVGTSSRVEFELEVKDEELDWESERTDL